MTTERKVIVKCSQGCGKTEDMTRTARVHASLGWNTKPKWICAECFKREYPKWQAQDEARRMAERKLREARRAS